MNQKHIYLLWFVALLPTMILRDFTPNNELRYLSIVDEALRNGNIFTFTNQGEIYADKPPLHFWLMMVGRLILGEHRMWYYSLLSFIPALVILMTMTKWIRRESGENEKTALLMLMTTGLFTGVAIIVRMDMLMNMFIVLSLYCFYQMYHGENLKRNSFLFPLYVFLALFSKGPLGLLIPLVSTVTFLIFKKKLSDFTHYWGWKSLLIVLSGCIVWFTGVYLEGGNEYLNNLLVHQTVDRGINSFHHKEPFYYYAISVWYSLAPWSLLAIGLLIAGLLKKRINSTLEQFFAAIILSTLVLLSLISSKLAIYALPVIPFVIYLAALLLKKFNMQNRWINLSLAIPAFILLAALPAVIYLTGTEEMRYLATSLVYAAAGVLSVTGLLMLYYLYGKRDTFRSIHTLAMGFLLAVFVAGWSLPGLNSYLGWNNLCVKAKELSEEHRITDYWVYHISRAENMDVYLGKDIIKVEKEDILKQPHENGLLMLPTKDTKNDPEILDALQNREQYQIGNYTIVVF
jgi:4-amino-4-deoxy-L-arabinose transferase-like glycosyltransferase